MKATSTIDISVLSREELIQLVYDQQQQLAQEQRLQAKLQEQDAVFHHLLEGTQAGYWDWQIERAYEFLSPRFKAIFGYTDEEMPHHPFSWKQLIHPDDLESVQDAFEQHIASKGQVPFSTLMRCYHRDGTLLWIYCRGQVIEWGPAGKPVRLVGLHFNLSEWKIQKSNRTHPPARAPFLAALSHELRSPLSSLLELIQLLLEKEPRPEQEKLLNQMTLSAETLLTTLSGLKNYQEIEAGHVQLDEHQFSLKEITEHLSNAFQPLFKATGNVLQIEFDAKLDVPLKGDVFRLTQLLNHLLSNALKFSYYGKVVLALHDLAHDDQRIQLEISVRDARLNDAFEHVSRKISRQNGGFELSVIQKLVDLHGGTLHIKHLPEGGLSIQCLLPLKKALHTPAGQGAQESDLIPSLAGIRVLVAEDNVINQLAVKRLLEQWQVERVDVATTGQEVLEQLFQQEYDVILLDLNLQEPDSFETARHIRAASRQGYLPIIGLSCASPSPELEQALLAVGVNDFISKPFQPIHLYQAIRQVVADGVKVNR